MRITGILSLILFSSFLAKAEISGLDIDENTVSNKETSSGTITIYGGLAGTDPNNSATYADSCTTTLAPCNHRRISDNLYLSISFSTSTDLTGKSPVVRMAVGDSDEFTPDESPTSITKGETLTAKIKWGNLCKEISSSKSGSSTSCDFDVSATTIYIGLDTDNNGELDEKTSFKVILSGDYLNDGATPPALTYHTGCPVGNETLGTYEGFCHFEIKKGDHKVHIIDSAFPDPNATGSTSKFPSTQDSNSFSKLHFYFNFVEGTPENPPACDPAQFAAVNATSDYDEVTLSETEDTWSLSNSTIEGLENGYGYYFIMANVDKANNVFGFSNASTYSTCDLHFDVPEEVLGLLSDEKCFIATAAYGSAFQEEVKTLRIFRDKYLMTNSVGKWFTQTYYKYSPYWADLIKKSETRREIARAFLSPVVAMVLLIFKFGWWLLAAFTLILAGGSYFAFRRKS